MSQDPLPSRLEHIPTLWSVVRRAHDGSGESAGEARSALVMRYAPAVRSYIGAMVKDADEASELAQDVVVRMLSGNFSGADPQRGRFRDLLKVAVRNMVRNHWSKQNRRRGVDYDLSLVGEEQDEAEDDRWSSAWRSTVLENTWAALEQHEREKPSSVAHTVLKIRTKHPEDSSEQLAERLGKKLGAEVRADAVRQKLRRARLKFAELLVEEIAGGLENPNRQRIEDELIALGLYEQVKSLLPTIWTEKGTA